MISIVETLVAGNFKLYGMEEKLLAHSLREAKKKGCTHAEVYPLERMTLDTEEFGTMLACYRQADFAVIRDLSDEMNGRYYIMQKEL